MENLKQEALRFIERLQILYFEDRNIKELLSAMAENTSWIGTGAQELCRNLEDAKTALSLETQEFSGHFKIIEANYDADCISDQVCIVYGDVTARPDNPEIAVTSPYHRSLCLNKGWHEAASSAYVQP